MPKTIDPDDFDLDALLDAAVETEYVKRTGNTIEQIEFQTLNHNPVLHIASLIVNDPGYDPAQTNYAKMLKKSFRKSNAVPLPGHQVLLALASRAPLPFDIDVSTAQAPKQYFERTAVAVGSQLNAIFHCLDLPQASEPVLKNPVKTPQLYESQMFHGLSPQTLIAAGFALEALAGCENRVPYVSDLDQLGMLCQVSNLYRFTIETQRDKLRDMIEDNHYPLEAVLDFAYVSAAKDLGALNGFEVEKASAMFSALRHTILLPLERMKKEVDRLDMSAIDYARVPKLLRDALQEAQESSGVYTLLEDSELQPETVTNEERLKRFLKNLCIESFSYFQPKKNQPNMRFSQGDIFIINPDIEEQTGMYLDRSISRSDFPPGTVGKVRFPDGSYYSVSLTHLRNYTGYLHNTEMVKAQRLSHKQKPVKQHREALQTALTNKIDEFHAEWQKINDTIAQITAPILKTGISMNAIGTYFRIAKSPIAELLPSIAGHLNDLAEQTCPEVIYAATCKKASKKMKNLVVPSQDVKTLESLEAALQTDALLATTHQPAKGNLQSGCKVRLNQKCDIYPANTLATYQRGCDNNHDNIHVDLEGHNDLCIPRSLVTKMEPLPAKPELPCNGYLKGARVKIRPGTRYAHECPVDGTLQSDLKTPDYSARVVFDNEFSESFTQDDLDILTIPEQSYEPRFKGYKKELRKYKARLAALTKQIAPIVAEALETARQAVAEVTGVSERYKTEVVALGVSPKTYKKYLQENLAHQDFFNDIGTFDK